MSGKKFRFSLDSVLTVRRHAAAKAEQAVAAALQARRAEEARLAEAEERLTRLDAPAPGAALAPADFQRLAGHRHDAMQARAAVRRTLDAARRRESAAHRALTDARRPEEALTTLRDGEWDAFRLAALRAEDAAIDEFATAAHARRRA
jgi:flagellar FliJ protein